MKTCKKCGMPDTRPGTYFEDGVCGACINYDNRGKIDWTKREEELKQICRHRIGQNEKYDCIAPVSGGKDSTFIVNKLVGLGMRPLLVTITDEFTHTQAGAHNVKNIAEQFNLDHIIFRHAPGDFKGFTLNDFVGELHPLKWIEGKINETPLMIAEALKIPLVFKGEYSPYEYGAVKDLETHITTNNTTIYYMYAFFPYDELETLEVARGLGFKDLDDFGEWDRQGSIEQFTQIDSIAYLVQLWTKFPKYGFQRVSDIASRMVRKGHLTLEQAELLIKDKDYICDPAMKRDFCNTLDISLEYFDGIVDKHANRDIVYKDVNGNWRRK